MPLTQHHRFSTRRTAVLVSLILPIIVSAVALFFASFLSWMVLQLHKKDWDRLEGKEDQVMAAIASCNLPVGSYMFPCAASQAEMKSEAFQKKYDAGPRGILTILPKTNMGQNLALNFAYFLAVSLGVAYLASLAFHRGTADVSVFQFVFIATFLVSVAAMVPQAIWFRARIVGHIIESVAYAAITAVIFTVLWPGTFF
jgi:hypothetical protein